MKGDRIAVLQPKRQLNVYRLDKDVYLPLPGGDAALTREAISFYQVASHIFSNGLYGEDVRHEPVETETGSGLTGATRADVHSSGP